MAGRDSRKRETPKVTQPTTIMAAFRGSLTPLLRDSPTASSMLMREVMPAKRTETKKKRESTRPPGSC